MSGVGSIFLLRDNTMENVTESTPLVEARELTKYFPLVGGVLRKARGESEVLKAVDGVNLRITRGETVGLVGESGCGKSTLGRTILRLYEPTAGQVFHKGINILGHGGRATRELRRTMQIVFQDPYGSLNPSKSVRSALGEVLKVHNICPASEREERIGALLEMVGLPRDAADRMPHQFSGGQRQRIGIARALAVGPDFIVADEAVSALDVSVQAQVLNLFMRLQDELELTYLFIAHNLGVVQQISRRVAVMYLGRIVEYAPTAELFREPLHPYSQALFRAMPRLEPGRKSGAPALEGDPPNPINRPSGCHFHTRCPHVMPRCRVEYPLPRSVGSGRTVACHLYESTPKA